MKLVEQTAARFWEIAQYLAHAGSLASATEAGDSNGISLDERLLREIGAGSGVNRSAGREAPARLPAADPLRRSMTG